MTLGGRQVHSVKSIFVSHFSFFELQFYSRGAIFVSVEKYIIWQVELFPPFAKAMTQFIFLDFLCGLSLKVRSLFQDKTVTSQTIMKSNKTPLDCWYVPVIIIQYNIFLCRPIKWYLLDICYLSCEDTTSSSFLIFMYWVNGLSVWKIRELHR